MTDSPPVLGRFASPTASHETRLAVLSDLHLTVDGEGTWRVAHRTGERLRTAVAALNRQRPDGVLFVGDLVQNGTRAEYEAFDRAIEDLDAPFLAVPGNHDLHGFGPGPKLGLAEFEREYTPGGLPYHERVGGVDVLGLNSNPSTRDSLAETYAGRLSPGTIEWLDDALAAAEDPLVAVHHNLPGTRSLLYDSDEQLPVSPGSPPFESADDLVAVLEGGGASLVVTGHVHFPAVVPTGGVREFTLPALGPYPAAYTMLEVTGRGTTAYLHSVAGRHDRTEALASGLDNARVLLAASQLAGLPLVDDLSGRPSADGTDDTRSLADGTDGTRSSADETDGTRSP